MVSNYALCTKIVYSTDNDSGGLDNVKVPSVLIRIFRWFPVNMLNITRITLSHNKLKSKFLREKS